MFKIPHAAVLSIAQRILDEAGVEDTAVAVNKTFLDYADLVKGVVGEWSTTKKNQTAKWLLPFLYSLREMRDDLAKLVERDPLIMYKPINKMTREFHRSLAKVRYMRSGNRCSKTEGARWDNYAVVTRQHLWRPLPAAPASIIVISTDKTNYCTTVFEPKYVYGEGGNILSPAFPEGGKWFHSYNRNDRCVSVACEECAEKGQAGSCKHPKGKIMFMSDASAVGGVVTAGKKGGQILAGGQHAQIQLDEQVKEVFFIEALERTKSLLNAGVVVTETPCYGRAWWTHKELTLRADKKDNTYYHPTAKKEVKYVELFTCSQYEGNIVPKSEIDAWCKGKPQEVIDLRVYGLPVSEGQHHVFDLKYYRQQYDKARRPKRGDLLFIDDSEKDERDKLRDIQSPESLHFNEDRDGPVYVWKMPKPEGQYIIGVDVAEGLAGRDASVATVYRMHLRDQTIFLEQVAKYKGWINPIPYGRGVAKIGYWYNEALVVPERNGPGHTVIHELMQELGYANVFIKAVPTSEVNEREAPMFGLTTSGESKPILVSIAQRMWKEKQVRMYCAESLEEIEHYIQERSPQGMVIRYHGEGDSPDDEVTAFLMASYVVKTDPSVYDVDYVPRQPDKDDTAMTAEDRAFWKWARTPAKASPRTMTDA